MDEIARIAALLADPARARMLWSLIDGTMRPAGELAYSANVSAQSASGHLAKLVDGGLIQAEAQGRHRYFRIANADVAAAVEALASLATDNRTRAPAGPVQFLKARTCYSHLAGEMAVKLLEGMLKQRWLSADGREYAVTQTGAAKLAELDIDVTEIRRPRRVFARACVDLTQRRPHLSGALGEALLETYLRRGWIQRQRRSRVVHITPKGHEAFRRWFGAS
jgi:DNA-binding transcriptional ArsR family regulator